jgi:hypothetical protein
MPYLGSLDVVAVDGLTVKGVAAEDDMPSFLIKGISLILNLSQLSLFVDTKPVHVQAIFVLAWMELIRLIPRQLKEYCRRL